MRYSAALAFELLSELANLKEADVHLEDQWVKVLGKGSKERMVAFGVAAQKTLLHCYYENGWSLRFGRHIHSPMKALSCSKTGSKLPHFLT